MPSRRGADKQRVSTEMGLGPVKLFDVSGSYGEPPTRSHCHAHPWHWWKQLLFQPLASATRSRWGGPWPGLSVMVVERWGHVLGESWAKMSHCCFTHTGEPTASAQQGKPLCPTVLSTYPGPSGMSKIYSPVSLMAQWWFSHQSCGFCPLRAHHHPWSTMGSSWSIRRS